MNSIQLLISVLGAGAGFSYIQQRGLADISKLFRWIQSKLPSKVKAQEQLRQDRQREIELRLIQSYRRDLAQMARQDVTVNGPWKRGWE